MLPRRRGEDALRWSLIEVYRATVKQITVWLFSGFDHVPCLVRSVLRRYESLSCMGGWTGQIGVTSENGGGSFSDE
jgi:hypothetical protein